MRPLRFSINTTLDGCCDHRAIVPDEELVRHHAENLEQADAILFGRVTYEMMEAAWRDPVPPETRPDWMESFARTMNAAKKYVVSRTLDHVDWNAELVRGDLGDAVRQLKSEPGKGLRVAGLKLAQALAELGLIDEYELVVQPRLAGHGPTLFAGLSQYVDLKLVSRVEFASGAVAMRYEPIPPHAAAPRGHPVLFRANNELALHVADPEAAATFYTTVLGGQIVRREPDWIEIASGALRIFLIRDPAPTHEAVVPSFDVPDRAAAIERLKSAGCTMVPIGPHAPDGYYIRDPFGVLFDIVERH